MVTQHGQHGVKFSFTKKYSVYESDLCLRSRKMLLSARILSSAAAIALTCAVSAAAYYYKSRKAEINEVMVFCKLQFNAYNYFDKLISHVEAAKESVNVCMPSIHNPAIQGRLVSLIKKNKIKVRIIIDRTGYNESTDFFIKELIDAGAEVKCKANEPFYKMQHKFCLVDDKVLMTGTLDWGNDRSADHWNYVYITSKSQLVEPVKRDFYQMWSQFSNDLEPIKEPLSCESDAEIVDVKFPEITHIISQTDLEEETSRETILTPEIYIL